MAPAPRPVRLSVVLADWCPHCVPVSEDCGRELARRLGLSFRRLDIDDPEEERLADALVEAHGDWSPDYLIPQVFLEWSNGRVEHLLTGDPAGVTRTRAAWDRLLSSPRFRAAARP